MITEHNDQFVSSASTKKVRMYFDGIELKPEDRLKYYSMTRNIKLQSKEWTRDRPKGIPEGPWNYEPDKAQWEHESGLPCIAVRGGTLVWCGYVGVSKNHPYFQKNHSEIQSPIDRALTYSNFCTGDELGICHVVENEEEPIWWIGFDCASNPGDALPFWDGRPQTLMANFVGDGSGATYKTYEWVRTKTNELATAFSKIII